MSVLGDLRHAIRLLRRTPAFTVPAVASLALGIAVNTTMFTAVNALLLRPLADANAGTIVRIGRSMNGDDSFRSVSYDELEFLQRHASSFSDVVGADIASLSFGGTGMPELVSAEIVTSNYFRALDRTPVVGRGFDERATETAVVLSDRFWRRRFAGDRSAIGRAVSIDNRSFTVVGVAPAGFTGAFPGVAVDVWLPAVRGSGGVDDPRALGSMDVIGIMKNGGSFASARAELQALSRRMSETIPARDSARGLVIAEGRGFHPALTRRIGPFVVALMGIVGVVLLIVCANVASLLLARANARRAEFGVRLALGASRRRLIAQLLVESLVLAAAGAAAGLALSWWAVGVINARTLTAGPTGAPVFLNLGLDLRVLAFTAIATMATTIAFGLVPALHGTRVDLISSLKDSRAAPDRRRSRLRGGLVVLQVTVSVVLLVGAAFLFRSVRNSTRVDLGFDPDGVVLLSFNLKGAGFDRGGADRFYDELLLRTRALPGVDRAAFAAFVPMGGRGGTVSLTNPRSTAAADGGRITVAYNRVSDDYFAAVGQPLIRGRGFTPRDGAGVPRVAIVNETLARRVWPHEQVVGKRIRITSEPGDPGIEREIVGVVRDAKFSSFGAPTDPFLFLPAGEGYGRAQTLHVRTTIDSSSIAAAVAGIGREIDDTVLAENAQTMREAMSFALVPARIAQTVLGVSGAIALLLAAGGLYGLVCYTVEQRLREIGIRVALGADQESVFRLIAGNTIRLTIVGVVIGLLLAAAGMRFVAWLLIGLGPTDVPTFGAIAALMAIVTLAAAYVGARKGLRVDPAVLLRYE